MRIGIIAILLLPIPSASLRLACGVKLIETSVPGVYAIVRDLQWVSTVTFSRVNFLNIAFV